MIDRTQLCKNSAEEKSHSLISQWQTRKEKAICKSREQSRPFAYPFRSTYPPQNLRDSKQRKGLRKKRLGKRLQEYACEQTIKFDFSIDISSIIGVEFGKIISEVTPRNSKTLTPIAAH